MCALVTGVQTCALPIYGEAVPGIDAELQLLRALLPTITLAEVGAIARELLGETNRVDLAPSPEQAGLTTVTAAGLAEAVGDRNGVAEGTRVGVRGNMDDPRSTEKKKQIKQINNK